MFNVQDKKVNQEIEKLQTWLKTTFGLENVSKEDVLRYLIQMKREKEDHPKWDSL